MSAIKIVFDYNPRKIQNSCFFMEFWAEFYSFTLKDKNECYVKEKLLQIVQGYFLMPIQLVCWNIHT